MWKLLRLSGDRLIQPLISLLKLCSEAIVKLKFEPENGTSVNRIRNQSCIFENLLRHFVFRLACGTCEFKKPRLLAYSNLAISVSVQIFIQKLGRDTDFRIAGSYFRATKNG